MKDKIIKEIDSLLSFFQEPKKWNGSPAPLIGWEIAVRSLKRLSKTKVNLVISQSLNTLEAMEDVFRAWKQSGFRTSFIMAVNQLKAIKRNLENL